jgi:hypothetical protein
LQDRESLGLAARDEMEIGETRYALA